MCTLHRNGAQTYYNLPMSAREPNVGAPGLAPARNSGARWVDRYFLPLLRERLPLDRGQSIHCLQIAPDDDDEAQRLREHGLVCDIVPASQSWSLPSREADYDVVFTGAFGRIANSRNKRLDLAAGMARLCRTGGGVFLTVGNRRCPLDLSGATPRFHLWMDPAAASLTELRSIFLRDGQFASLSPLSLNGMFGWSSRWAALSLVTRCVAGYLNWSSRPSFPRLYASPLNPLLSVWIQK